MGSVFSFSAGYIYSRNKSRKGALIGAVVGAALMAVLSVPFNYLLMYPVSYTHLHGISPFRNEQYRNQGNKAIGKLDCYQKVIICPRSRAAYLCLLRRNFCAARKPFY